MPTAIARLFSRRRILVSRIAGFLFVGVLLAMQSGQADNLEAAILYILGLTLIGVATAGRLWCALYISGYKGSTLVTAGPYSMCRNPLYFFSMCGFVGIGFSSETYTLGIAALVIFSLVYPSVIKGEEVYLRGQFGKAFDDYCAATPSFFPRLSALREPTSYTVNPQVFRRALKDIIWFVWAAGFIELIEAFHELGYIKPLITLY